MLGCRNRTEQTTDLKQLYVPKNLSYRYFIPSSLGEACKEKIPTTIRKFPIWQEMSLKRVSSSAEADFEFVESTDAYRVDFKNGKSSAKIHITKADCKDHTFDLLYPGIAMITRLIKEQRNIKFAGSCGGVPYDQLEFQHNSSSPTGVQFLRYKVKGNSGLSDIDEVIREAADTITHVREVVLSNNNGLKSPQLDIVFMFESMGQVGDLSTAGYDSNGNGTWMVKLNKDRLNTQPKVFDQVHHEFLWALYQEEVKNCRRFKIGRF